MPYRCFALIGALALSLSVAGVCQGVSGAAPVAPAVPPTAVTAAVVDLASPSAIAAAPADFQVGAGDVLQIEVLNMPQFSRSVMVNPDGTIRLAYTPEPTKAQGQTADQIAAALDAELKLRQVFVDPQLAVTVTQVRSRPVTISGAVRTPMVLQEVEPLHLLDALVAAGGVYDSSASDVLVTSPASPAASRNTVDLPVDKVLSDAGAQYNPMLEAGDIVQVLPGARVFVAGDVKNPGALPLAPGQPLHLTQALALVGSWNRGAGAGKATITRRSTADGPFTVIPVDLPRVMDHRDVDVVLQANDLLYVPGNAKRQLGLAAAGGIGTAMMLGLGYMIVRY